MDYKQTLDYLFSQLPMFHRIGAAAYKADLNNTNLICGLLNDPQEKFRSVHVAGTNGKGSVSHFLASIFQENGYRTGLYTSPHLRDFRERIRIDGKIISQEDVVDFIKKYKSVFEEIKPSFFEWTVGLAFDYFINKKVDIAIIETGLGGRLDSTNVIHPEASVITNIGWDHSNLLGDTLGKISKEKAGIIKRKIPVVIGETQQHSQNIFIEKAKENDSEIFFADQIYNAKNVSVDHRKNIALELMMEARIKNEFRIFDQQQIRSGLAGTYQLKNIKTVCLAIEVLISRGFKFEKEKTNKGFENVVKNTGMQGRWQMLSDHPLTYCDIAHNSDGIKEILLLINNIRYSKLHVVLGVVNDKDIGSILSLLPKDAEYYFCRASIPRALDDKELHTNAEKHGLKGNAYGTVRQAYDAAVKAAGSEDMIYIGGSTFVVAEVL